MAVGLILSDYNDMKTTIHQSAIYRIPRFPINAELNQCWDELKEAIRLSSIDFYEIIKDTSTDQLDQLPKNVKHTIWKYFNRARFRATPFGMFAGFGLTDIKYQTLLKTLIVDSDFIMHRYEDWSNKDSFSASFHNVVKNDELLIANTSYYRMGSILRYVYFEDGKFQLSEVAHSLRLEHILSHCSKPIKISALKNKCPDIDPQTLLSEIDLLISIQLLFHSGQPNIIGQDYFQRRGMDFLNTSKIYVLAESRTISGAVDTEYFRHLPALVEKLTLFQPKSENASLQNFVIRFIKKFDQKQVPLMLALDPEVGVGYDDLEQSEMLESELINSLSLFTNASRKENLKFKFDDLLLQQIGIRQHSIDFEQLKPPSDKADGLIPNTLSVMCLLRSGQLHIENIGGATANALNGRFTLASDEVHNLCKELAGIEQSANPDVLFFDVAYVAESSVDNINRRREIYPFQLSILNYDTSENPLELTDLFLSVSGNDLVLYSKRLDKQLIPRLSSAYNYQRSDLSVFRLLCDLQHQNLMTNLNLDLVSLYPDLDYYPELRYRNIVLSPRTWRLDRNSIKDLQTLKDILAVNVDCRFVLGGKSDQTICFDLENSLDLEILLHLITKEGQLLVEEYHIANPSPITGSDGQPYAAQMLLNLVHREELYHPLTFNKTNSDVNVTELFPPGKQWLYFEIYCHPSRANGLLHEKIQPYLINNSMFLKTWFFIRYNENGNHLRLRLKMSNDKFGYRLTHKLTELLENDLKNGIVSDLRINVYRREIDRYGPEMIEIVEQHFCSDSRYIMTLLSSDIHTFTKYNLCIQLLLRLSGQGILSMDDLYKLVSRNAQAYNNEHHLKSDDYKKINVAYKKYRSHDFATLDSSLDEARLEFEASFYYTIQICAITNREAMITDLIHMHLNRLFSDNQRSHEMICYYFLAKEMDRINAIRPHVK